MPFESVHEQGNLSKRFVHVNNVQPRDVKTWLHSNNDASQSPAERKVVTFDHKGTDAGKVETHHLENPQEPNMPRSLGLPWTRTHGQHNIHSHFGQGPPGWPVRAEGRHTPQSKPCDLVAKCSGESRPCLHGRVDEGACAAALPGDEVDFSRDTWQAKSGPKSFHEATKHRPQSLTTAEVPTQPTEWRRVPSPSIPPWQLPDRFPEDTHPMLRKVNIRRPRLPVT